MKRERAVKLRQMLVKASASLPDEDAVQCKELYDAWKPDTEYEAKDRKRYNGKLYRCEQAHTSQAHYTPDIIQAIWTEIAMPGEIPVWKRPTGAQDSYDYGDKVYYPTKDDDIYQSVYNGKNSWSPDEYPEGWEKLT